MGKAKKKWKKQAPDAQLNLQVQKERERKDLQVKDMKDDQLYTLDFDKKSAKKARMTLKEKLRIKKLKDEQKKVSKTQKVLRERARKKLNQTQRKSKSGNSVDLWGDQSIEPKINKKKKKFIEFTKIKQIPLPSVLKPMPGQSYNPSGKDYQELTQKVVQMKLNELQKVDQIKSKIYPGIYKSQILKLQEESQDDEEEEEEDYSSISQQDGNDDDDDILSDDQQNQEDEQNYKKDNRSQLSSDTYSDYFSQQEQNNPTSTSQQARKKKDIAKVTLRKTKKQKMKKHLNKLKQQSQKQQRMKRKLLKQIPGIPSMVGQMQKQKRQNEQRKRDKAKMNQQIKQLAVKGQIIKPKRLGKHMYKEQIPAFKLLDQIPGNLRQSKAAQSLIKDRFDSLMRLGKTEVRWDADTGKRSQSTSTALKRKLKKKQYEKTTGFSDRKQYHQASAQDSKERREKGIFY